MGVSLARGIPGSIVGGFPVIFGDLYSWGVLLEASWGVLEASKPKALQRPSGASWSDPATMTGFVGQSPHGRSLGFVRRAVGSLCGAVWSLVGVPWEFLRGLLGCLGVLGCLWRPPETLAAGLLGSPGGFLAFGPSRHRAWVVSQSRDGRFLEFPRRTLGGLCFGVS